MTYEPKNLDDAEVEKRIFFIVLRGIHGEEQNNDNKVKDIPAQGTET